MPWTASHAPPPTKCGRNRTLKRIPIGAGIVPHFRGVDCRTPSCASSAWALPRSACVGAQADGGKSTPHWRKTMDPAPNGPPQAMPWRPGLEFTVLQPFMIIGSSTPRSAETSYRSGSGKKFLGLRAKATSAPLSANLLLQRLRASAAVHDMAGSAIHAALSSPEVAFCR